MTIRIVCISDTHEQHHKVNVPYGDVLIHAGDFCLFDGTRRQVKNFASWFASQPHLHKVVISGNHDAAFQTMPDRAREWLKVKSRDSGAQVGCHYLENETVDLDIDGRGLKIHGAPQHPGDYGMAFTTEDEEDRKAKWALFPMNSEIIVVHGPPYGILDETKWDEVARNPFDGAETRIEHSVRDGCRALRRKLEAMSDLKLVVCGHIHSGFGTSRLDSGALVVNAALCGAHHLLDLKRRPIVVDLSPQGTATLVEY